MLEMLRMYRRDLHQIPEIGMHLPKTKEYILNKLKNTKGEIIELCDSAILVYFDNHKETTMAFRSDMDALEIEEKNKTTYVSKHHGNMHACGHDGHMAMLLAFAIYVNNNYQCFSKNILLIFQPGEESDGGAKRLCEEGIIQKYNVKEIYGTHVFPGLQKGKIALCKEKCMASSVEITITLYGKKSHVVDYQKGIDTIEGATNLLLRLQKINNEIFAKEYSLMKYGYLHSGNACNVVSDLCVMKGTIRTFHDSILENIKDQIQNACIEMEKETKCHFSIDYSEGYPSLINSKELVEEIYEENPNLVLIEKPSLLSEDFSYYLQETKGLFFFLGTGDTAKLHSDYFDFDEEILLNGVDNYCRLANKI